MQNFDWNRFNNYGLWVALLSLIPIVLNMYGINVVPEVYQPIINAILSVFVTLGILNNPTTQSKWFLDDKKDVKKDESK